MITRSKWFRRSLCALAVGLAATAQAQQISMETGTPSSVSGLVSQTMASRWGEDGVDVQLSMNQTMTKSVLKIGQGKLDAAMIPPNALGALRAGTAPYLGLGDKGAAVADNIRALFSIPTSYYHAITWADSGIDSWADAAGKRVFIGPPGGAANAQITALADAGGLPEGQYDAVKAPWGSATQGFQDGQFDVLVMIYALGSQALSELSLSRDINLLSLTSEKAEPPEGLGLTRAAIPADTYPGQTNDADAVTWKTLMMMGVRRDLPDELAYQLTKSYVDRVGELAASNALLGELAGADPLAGLNARLHPGAARYYREKGIRIPENLLPN
ncbi:C4-dicarboxylate ABC transporter [Marinobacterium nitratireducens]|uniref:C4-dicarboxylate ABC transporter n=1 Tax=Marinobacterium nitratireducens TaxID=518897 RepID=A0A917ZHY3_9GAMM|nr:TAXI family TRAP transporter solute-binding subunit [Marinobacterium nitratireducens]GGO83440.1 C4-dicarboxylate ABC transporter [Marinobacterium nitratireducens]